MEEKGYKFYIEAEFKEVIPTEGILKELASVIDLPQEGDRQPDLSYFSSIFVSTGTNLNNAHFLTSEILKASNTIPFKAVDIEHEEDQIIGHIYKHAYIDKHGKQLSEDFIGSSESVVNKEKIHVEIASVIYKARFPEIAKEISEKKWKVSMEAYFRDFDILIGNTIMTKDEAAALGLDYDNEASYGTLAKIVKAGEVVDEGKIARVLRGIIFSGVGIVKNPANPPSVILETTANEDVSKQTENIQVDDKESVIILNYDNLETSDNNVTIPSIDTDKNTEVSDLVYNDTVGVCVNYKKEMTGTDTSKGPDTKVIHSNWCTKYDQSCTSEPYGNATVKTCLRFVIGDWVYVEVSKYIKNMEERDKIESLTDTIFSIIPLK